MSSMTEGSEDGAREDEPQLENNDNEQFPVIPGWEANNEGKREQHEIEPGRDAFPDEPLSATSSRDPAMRESDSALHSESDEVPSVHNREVNKGIGSGDDFGSIPDDTPSVQDSNLSSRSSAFGLRGSPSNLSPSHHRPFDRRFQSRLSVSLPVALRPQSPSLIGPHSRNSSISHVISSTPDLLESPAAPWEVVRWTKLRKITGQAFSEVGKRNFGQPACISISTAIVIGTAKGIIMVFDYQQNLNAIIGPGTKAVESGPITSLAISADHTTIAAGHGSGHIFTWEISKPARPFLHIPPISAGQLENKRTNGHISGVAVIHMGFLGTRHTALVSADDHGMAFSHLANRGMGAVGRVVRTTRILGRYPDAVLVGGRLRKPSSVLAFSPLPLGNVPQATDPIGLVALLTPYLLVIVSTTPVARTQYKAPRPKEVAAHSALTAALAWFPAIKLKGKNSEASKTKLVYCWSNVLTVLEVSEVKSPEPANKDRPPSFEFKPRSRWRAEEGIVAVQWISRSVLAVMTITQQLLILEDNTLRMTDSFDLIHKHIYHVDIFSKQLHSLVEQLDEEDESMHGVIADAFYMSFRAYKGRLFLLGVNDISVGSLSNWADRLLSLMEGGDFIGAIRLATSYYIGNTEKLTVGLPEEDDLRHQLVQEKLLEMISASIRYAFGRNQEAPNERLSPSQLEELADSCIAACDALQDYEFLFNEVYSWYEECGSEGIILDTLEPYIVQGSIRTLPPTAVKSLITHYITNHTATRLEEIICLLDTSTIDIDQVTSLCKQHNLYDAFIYVWTRALSDYLGPLVELIHLIHQHTAPNVNGNADVKAKDLFNAMKMFPYLSYVLTGRIYPTGEDLPDLEASKAKAAIYDFLFSGISVTSSSKKAASQDSFLDLRTILEFDTPSFMSMLNEAFEDSFLNDATDQASNGAIMPTSSDSPTHGLSINRQYLISILLEIMESSNFGPENTVYLDMFIARNLPKYPQYILLSGSTLQQILMRLCRYPNPEMIGDCQLSVEYLLSIYRPPDIQALIPLLKQAKFYRVLKSIYKTEKQFPDLLLTYLEDPEDQRSIFDCIRDCLRPSSKLSKKQRHDVHAVVKDHAAQIADIDVERTAHTVQATASDLHTEFLHVLENDSSRQYLYLNTIFEPEWRRPGEAELSTKFGAQLVECYVQLMCQYNPSHVKAFVDILKVGDLKLDAVLPSMESSGVIDAAIILLARQGEIRAAMDRLIKHLGTLEAGLSGLLQNANESPDSASMAEAVVDLVQSLDKYTRVGIWLCQQQSNASRQSRGGGKSNKTGAATLKLELSFEENLWLDLIEMVVRIARNMSPLLRESSSDIARDTPNLKAYDTRPGEISSFFRVLVQQVFTALLTSTTKSGDRPGGKSDMSFLRILRAFLTRVAAASPSLSELRSVIASIFSAYTYEESLLSLANAMLDKDLFVHVDEITKLRQRGWRPRGQVCEVCRRRVWGPGSGPWLWEAWQKKQEDDAKRGQARRLDVVGRTNLHSYGKGKEPMPRGHANAHTPRQNTNQTTQFDRNGQHADRLQEDPGQDTGPLVVFGCRHLYHRTCLVKEAEKRGIRGQSAPSHHADGLDLACLICRAPK
ncbi:golgi complex component [Histoplasma capsulatum var. duboisii H88]|uniref:Golgi complex component n=1 Tax=Ajellomyces capsulatus (strain H88) TaxID=544711 RepID=F0ULG6_AJEC8|nr:golgi complex component [Histoplasma capsulatum var. duboisii H88]QSS56855.1 golgi complex component [Histoplasma capsulatum var. duboisii H88]